MNRDIQQKPTTLWLLVLSMFALLLSIRLIMMIVSDNSLFPVSSLKIKSSYQYVSRDEIQKILFPYFSKSYLMISEKNLSDEIKKNEWIQDVKVNKIWPDRIVVQILERIPVAFWNNMLLSEKGEIFMPKEEKKLASLPYLYGPKYHQQDVLHIYEKLSKLLKAQDLYIAKIWLRENQSWKIALTNGVIIQLGKIDIENRLQRFCDVYPKLFAATFDQVSSIDLRYSKGIAVKWTQQTDQINTNPKT